MILPLPRMRATIQKLSPSRSRPSRASCRDTVLRPEPVCTVNSKGVVGSSTGCVANHASQPATASAAMTPATSRFLSARIVFGYQGLHPARDRTGRPSPLAQPGDRPHPDEAIGEEHFVRAGELLPADLALLARDAGPIREIPHTLALRPDDAAAIEPRRGEAPAARDEQVAHGALDHAPRRIAEEPFGSRGIEPFGARQHVLEPV